MYVCSWVVAARHMDVHTDGGAGQQTAAGWQVGTYVGRSCPVAPPLMYEQRSFPDAQMLRDAVPPVDDPALRCFAARLQRREPLNIAVFGTSVVAGNRCTKQNGANFPQLLMQLLARRFPGGNLTLSTFGYPGASPQFLRSCSDTLLTMENVDLYILEMMDNLSHDYQGFGTEIEMLMGALRQRSPGAALVLLSPMLQSCTRGLQIPRWKPYHTVPTTTAGTLQILETCYRNDTVAAAFEAVGPAHGVSVVSIRQMLRRRLWAAPDDASRLLHERVADAVHPTGRGHWEYALAIEHAIGQRREGEEWGAVDPHECRAGDQARTWAPLAPKNVFAPRSGTAAAARATICAFGPALRPYVLRSAGFEYQVDYNKQGLPKPGYRATVPGAELDLCFSPEPPPTAKLEKLAKGSGVAKVRTAWSIGYLMSYEGMGSARGECLKQTRSSCSCPPRTWDATWKRPVSQPHISRLMPILKYAKDQSGTWAPAGMRSSQHRADDPDFYTGPRADGPVRRSSCTCVIRLTNLNETHKKKRAGYNFKLTSLMSGFYTGNLVGQAAQWAADYDVI